MVQLHIYTDGGSRGNPGPAASAYIGVIKDSGKERIIRKQGRRIGRATNNQAEYSAMIMALEWARSRGFDDLVIHSDSQLLIKQIRGEYRVKSPRVKDLHKRVMDLLFGVSFRAFHHGRDEPHIRICDDLVNSSLDGQHFHHVPKD